MLNTSLKPNRPFKISGSICKIEPTRKTTQRVGFKVIRFTDEEVFKNINAVIEAIQCVVEEREKAAPFTPASGGQLPVSP